jgi:hypothetical protein
MALSGAARGYGWFPSGCQQRAERLGAASFFNEEDLLRALGGAAGSSEPSVPPVVAARGPWPLRSSFLAGTLQYNSSPLPAPSRDRLPTPLRAPTLK